MKTFKTFHHISYTELELARVSILRYHLSNHTIMLFCDAKTLT